MNSGFEPPEGTEANLLGPEWPSTMYCTSEHFAVTTTPPSPSCGLAERPLQGVVLGLGGNQAAKGRPGSSRVRRPGHCFSPSGGVLQGEGRWCVLGTRPVALPGDSCISASQRWGFVKCRESPWKPKGTRRRAPGGSAGSRASLSFPSRTPALQQGLLGVVVPRRRPRAAAKMRGAACPRLPLTC